MAKVDLRAEQTEAQAYQKLADQFVAKLPDPIAHREQMIAGLLRDAQDETALGHAGVARVRQEEAFLLTQDNIIGA